MRIQFVCWSEGRAKQPQQVR